MDWSANAKQIMQQQEERAEFLLHMAVLKPHERDQINRNLDLAFAGRHDYLRAGAPEWVWNRPEFHYHVKGGREVKSMQAKRDCHHCKNPPKHGLTWTRRIVGIKPPAAALVRKGDTYAMTTLEAEWVDGNWCEACEDTYCNEPRTRRFQGCP